MFHEEEILDDLLNNVFEELLNLPFNIQTSRGISSEQIGALLVLKNPRARLSRTETKGKPFSALGELLWYLAGSNDLNFIKYYIQFYEEEELWEEDSKGEKVIYGGYGPRFFDTRGHNQFRNIIDLLKESPNARRAVIQLFDADDLAQKHKDIPCTCTMQFMIRNGELNMYTNMRSNDAFLGLPHDVFAFTMIQEIVARSLEIKLGTYYHAVGSLHLYKKHRKKARQYLNEGLQSTKAVMPKMPAGNPWTAIAKILKIESKIRNNADLDISVLDLDPYWEDLIRLLQVHSLMKNEDIIAIRDVQKHIEHPDYKTYIQQKLATLKYKKSN